MMETSCVSPVTKRSRRNLGRRKLQVLQTLSQHPLLSRRQLELACDLSVRKAQEHLAFLRRQGWVTEYSARQPLLYARALYALTPAGNGILESQGKAISSLSVTRLAHLIVRMERVFQTRNLFLWLAQGPRQDWEIIHWDVEVEYEFQVQEKLVRIPFHGAAHVKRLNGRWVTVFVEFDTGRVPVANLGERMRAFVQAQRDPRFAYSRTEDFPTLVIIASDPRRLQEYYALIHTSARAFQLPVPTVYLALSSEAIQVRDDKAASIWYSTSLGRRTALFTEANGNTTTYPLGPTWQLIVVATKGQTNDSARIEPLGSEGRVGTGLVAYASVSLALDPIDKQLIDEVARHPLLTAEELTVVLQVTAWYVEKHLRQLVRWQLVEGYGFASSGKLVRVDSESERPESLSKNPGVHYLIGTAGVCYLAAVAGFDRRVSRYARARGWGKGLDALVKYYEHTRQENAVFLQLALAAQKRKHLLTWLSETESRLYYSINDRRHSFMPDGRGTYWDGERRFEFTVEIDRSRASRKKLRRKLNEYIACLMANVLRGEQVERLSILFVTQSWERAETVRNTILALACEKQAERILDLYITTFARLQASGPDAAIWMTLSESTDNRPGTLVPKTYCFDCFRTVTDG